MSLKDPYQVIINRHVTEKAKVLRELQNSKSNPSVSRCESPKEVFIVNPKANKRQIAIAIEEIYKDRQVKVVAVNTINVKGKLQRRRGHLFQNSSFKKAVVTFEKGDSLDIN